MIRIILSGCCGKMGSAVIKAVEAQKEKFVICAGVDKFFSPMPFPVYSDISKCTEKADVIMDFSRPDALPQLLKYAQQTHTALVLASTGYNKNDISSIKFASENVPIMQSSNFSLGINLLKELSSKASSILNSSYDIEIIEKHHNTKVDAPSGTALMLADAVNDAAGGDLEYVYDRHERKERRPKREIGISAIRAGSITGEHTVLFAGSDEVIELTHTAYSRNIYAGGALRAAEFILSLPCGLYDMSSLLTQKQIITHAYASESDTVFTVSSIKDAVLIKNIFAQLKDSDIMVDIISQPVPINGEYMLSFSVPSIMAKKAERIVSDLLNGEILDIRDDVSKITVEGSGMAHHAGVAGDVISLLGVLEIPVLLITTSETKITCCVPRQDTQRALDALKECFTTEGVKYD